MNILLIILLMIVVYRSCYKIIDYYKKDNYASRDYITIYSILNSNFSDRDKIQILREFINNQINKTNKSKSKTGLKFYER